MMSLSLPIDPAHPAFEGHFPSRPIVPGVVLLDHGLRALATRRGTPDTTGCRIGSAKFLSFVLPGEQVRMELDRVDSTVAAMAPMATAGTVATMATMATKENWQMRIFAGRPGVERLAMTGNVSFERVAPHDERTGA